MKAKELFNGENKEVPFAWIDPDFTQWFGEMKVEEKGQVLVSQKLPRTMASKKIWDDLKPGTVSLGDIYETLKALDHDVWALFYAKNGGAVSLLVGVRWFADGRGWCVSSDPFTNARQWGAGSQLFSRNSRDTESLGTPDPLSLGDLETRIKELEDWRDKLTHAWNGK